MANSFMKCCARLWPQANPSAPWHTQQALHDKTIAGSSVLIVSEE